MEKILTLAELADKSGGNYDTLYRKARRKFPEIQWTKESVVSADQIAVLSGEVPQPKAKRTAPATIKESLTVAPEVPANRPVAVAKSKPFQWPVFDLSALLALIIYAHTGLVWYEVATIFVMPGFFAGVMLAGMKHAAIVVVRSGKFENAVHHALAVALVLDLLAWYVHYTSFFAALRNSRFMSDMGQDSYTVAGVLAAVVCSGAFMSLFIIFKIKSK